MGLDMYLTAEMYISPYANDNAESTLRKAIATAIDLPETEKNEHNGVGCVVGVNVRAAYWRKANHIHKWFVDNVQNGDDNCNKYRVRRDQLDELRAVCENVLAKRGEPNCEEFAEENLPIEEGFFFGGKTYEDWYFEDLERTIHMLAPERLDSLKHFDFEYQASW